MPNMTGLILLGSAMLVATPVATLAEVPVALGAPLENGSFEEIDPRNSLPSGWSARDAETVIIRIDGQTARDGKHSVQMLFGGLNETCFVVRHVTLPKVHSAVFRVSAWVRGLDFDGNACLEVYHYPNPRGAFQSKKMTGTFLWQRISVDLPCRPEDKELQIRVQAAGSWGQVWFDQVEVTAGEGSK